MPAHQVALDVTANDLSNVNTVGFKKARVDKDEIITALENIMMPQLIKGHLVADVVALIGSIDIVLGEVDR